MFRWAWHLLFAGRPTRGAGPLFRFQWFSHRTLRYASGILHLTFLLATTALLLDGTVYVVAWVLQLAWLALAGLAWLRVPLPGAGIAYYYLLVTLATIVGAVRSQSDSSSRSKRCDSTTWKMSPAAMCVLALRTAASYSSCVWFDDSTSGPTSRRAVTDSGRGDAAFEPRTGAWRALPRDPLRRDLRVSSSIPGTFL